MADSRRPDPQRRPRPASARGPMTGAARPSGGASASRRPAAAKRYRARRSFPTGNPGKRLRVLMVGMVLVFALCAGRALQLQAFDSAAYAAKAAKNMTLTSVLVPQRGQILDRNGEVLATSQPAVDIIADPYMVNRNGISDNQVLTESQREIGQAAPAAIAQVLAKHLGGSPATYLKLLTTHKKNADGTQGELAGSVVIKKQVPAYTYAQIADDLAKTAHVDGYKVNGWYGLYKQDDPVRVYPNGDLASNVVGYVNSNGQAVAGLEQSLNASLAGVDGYESYETSAYGRIPLGNSTLTPAVNGTSYTLTIDAGMQLMAQNALYQQVKATHAQSGTAIVMNVKTGELLSMATVPTFNANNLDAAGAQQLSNRAVSDAYEPGSVEKVLTMSTLADDGLVTPDTHIVVPPSVKSASDITINDDYEHGYVNMTVRGVVANSSNIGTVLLARRDSKQSLVNHLRSFGLGQATNLGLPNESSGTLPPATMLNYTRDQIAFGQGLSVTAVQMAAAVSAAVNGGVYHAPTIIKSAVDGDGHQVAVQTAAPHRVISAKASSEVLDMMESVITQIGSGSREIADYRMAGKSGTAQLAGKNGYSAGHFTASFVGVAPVENPQILVYVVLQDPTVGGHQGSQAALPVVRTLMSAALPRYGVLPSTTPARHEPLTFN